MRVINDCHIGAVRASGTTGASQLALKQHVHEQFLSLLATGDNDDLLILGDLFDKHNVALDELLFTYTALSDWCNLHESCKLLLVSGNHDACKSSNVLSSFDLLCELLVIEYDNVVVIKDGLTETPYGYVIPHMPNQELFDAELAKVPECQNLFVHCNIMSPFAAQSDQSLNMTKDQIDTCKAKRIICAHEHNKKVTGKVLIPGNQIATSISDWVNSSSKYLTEVGGEHAVLLKCRERESEYLELDWKDLSTSAKFVRVVGEATAEQSAQVVSAIAKYRAKCDALVVTNAAVIASNEATGAFSESLESLTAFNVWNALSEFLEPAETALLESLK